MYISDFFENLELKIDSKLSFEFLQNLFWGEKVDLKICFMKLFNKQMSYCLKKNEWQ